MLCDTFIHLILLTLSFAQILLDKYVSLDESKCAVDIGHGAGLFLLQLAHTVGCKVRGIEVVESRNFVAEQFKEAFSVQDRAIIRNKNKVYAGMQWCIHLLMRL